MYVTISAQKMSATYSQSSSDFANYLEKEDQHLPPEQREKFFSHYSDDVSKEQVVNHIDSNKYKLKNKDPKFYSITLNPNQKELQHIKNNPQALRDYTRNVMKEYASSFQNTINGRKVTVDDIVYYAKIEKSRAFKHTDTEVKANRPFLKKINYLEKQKQDILSGLKKGSIDQVEKKIKDQVEKAPYKINGLPIKEGVKKPGANSHVHIIVSRMDRSNRVSISPGSKYKASTTTLHGKTVQRGFNRDAFFQNAEKVFDKQFSFHRNYVSSYNGFKDMKINPERFFLKISGLPSSDKAVAFKMLQERKIPMLKQIPTNQAQLIKNAYDKLIQGAKTTIKSVEIGI